MNEFKVKFRTHAIQRMFERSITEEEIELVISEGEVIKKYPEDKPYPSRLILGWIDKRPLHVVVAINRENSLIIVVTVYEPDPEIWTLNFKRRQKS